MSFVFTHLDTDSYVASFWHTL